MNPYYADDHVTLYHGDCLDVLASLPDNSVDSVVTDPPYLIAFMGRTWDASNGIAGQPDVWREVLRVLKPGGHLLAFGAPRTYHRMAVAIEDAGFEVRDSLMWMFGSGFPKSMDVGKAIDKAAGAERERYDRPAFGGTFSDDDGTTYGTALSNTAITPEAAAWDGWGTALKPAHEPIVLARKPLRGTVAANVLAWGVGGLNVDGCRVDAKGAKLGGGHSSAGQQMDGGWRRPWMDDPEAVDANAERSRASVAKSESLGRWPANVILDAEAGALLDQQSGEASNGRFPKGGKRSGNSDSAYGTFNGTDQPERNMGDSGGASRFFYTPKADRHERPKVNGVSHPTVKPVDLMAYLVRLVTPRGGLVLDPFAGTGTTAEAATAEGCRTILIEREADYLPLIMQRLNRPVEVTLL